MSDAILLASASFNACPLFNSAIATSFLYVDVIMSLSRFFRSVSLACSAIVSCRELSLIPVAASLLYSLRSISLLLNSFPPKPISWSCKVTFPDINAVLSAVCCFVLAISANHFVALIGVNVLYSFICALVRSNFAAVASFANLAANTSLSKVASSNLDLLFAAFSSALLRLNFIAPSESPNLTMLSDKRLLRRPVSWSGVICSLYILPSYLY